MIRNNNNDNKQNIEKTISLPSSPSKKTKQIAIFSQTHVTQFPGIVLKSIQIQKPQIDSSFYLKLSISIILDQYCDQTRHMIRLISSKFSMTLYDQWDKYYYKQKQLQKKLKNITQPETGQLLIINQNSLHKIYREIKLNPSLRVILLVKNIQKFEIKQEHSFMLVTSEPKEVQAYLMRNKKRLIVTARK